VCVCVWACSCVFLCLRNIHTYGDYTRTQILHINVGLSIYTLCMVYMYIHIKIYIHIRLLAYADMHVHSIHVSKATQPTQPTQCNTPNTNSHALTLSLTHKITRVKIHSKHQITLSHTHTLSPPPTPPPTKHHRGHPCGRCGRQRKTK